MQAPKLPSFFKTRNSKRFLFKPRYYDERKERIKQLKEEGKSPLKFKRQKLKHPAQKGRGRIIILGDAGINLGDSMYDGTIFIGGKIKSFGSDAVKAKVTSDDISWLKRKLKVAEIGSDFNFNKMTKVVAGKKLWNYDALEPSEKKGAI